MDDNNMFYDLSSRPSKKYSVAKKKVVDRKTKIKNLQPKPVKDRQPKNFLFLDEGYFLE